MSISWHCCSLTVTDRDVQHGFLRKERAAACYLQKPPRERAGRTARGARISADRRLRSVFRLKDSAAPATKQRRRESVGEQPRELCKPVRNRNRMKLYCRLFNAHTFCQREKSSRRMSSPFGFHISSLTGRLLTLTPSPSKKEGKHGATTR